MDLATLLGQSHTIAKKAGAAQAVVEQAGGRVETLVGQPLDYGDPMTTLNPTLSPGAMAAEGALVYGEVLDQTCTSEASGPLGTDPGHPWPVSVPAR